MTRSVLAARRFGNERIKQRPLGVGQVAGAGLSAWGFLSWRELAAGLPSGSKPDSVRVYGQAGDELLQAFDALPPEDKQAFDVEILRRTRHLPFDSGPLPDEEIGGAGKALFAFLDQQENEARTR